MRRRLDELRREASQAVADGVTILILSDRGVNAELGAAFRRCWPRAAYTII